MDLAPAVVGCFGLGFGRAGGRVGLRQGFFGGGRGLRVLRGGTVVVVGRRIACAPRGLAGVGAGGFDIAEIHAPFSSQELLLREAMGIGDDVAVNPSGGALSANPIMAAGLARFGEAAQRIIDGTAGRAVAHCTSGPCLQQNLVAVLEGES